ncbi:MAG: DNA recombination protein RmuC [Clostridia bacterium]|nr:DNA recombination protein RmuC [Clostridia bacterium]
MENILLIILAAVQIILLAIAVILIISNSKKKENIDVNSLRNQIREDAKADSAILRQELTSTTQASIKNMGEMINTSQSQNMANLENRFKTFSLENEPKLDNIRQTVSKQLNYIQEDNNKKLDEMRQTVDEKLQKTLESTMQQSFGLVNERLEQVYKGLGEMQNLAVGVGDLKKVLSNVKTRGILGEIQLGAILKEILATEQYDENVVTKSKGTERVEFAVKLPAEDDGFIYLPIDSKFPADTYMALQNAYESADSAQVEAAAKLLLTTLKKEAKDIHDKYIEPPYTTEFAIMFLPTEGLYCEAVNRGMIEILQREYKVNLAGPSTMAALLNSLQMGFKTLAVQKRSAEVWKVLGSVKNEFEKFGDVIDATQKRLEQANSELDKLVGVRTRAINRHLKAVETNNIPIETFSVNMPLLGEDE